MVWITEKPSFRAASCCKVEVVNGGAGERFNGFVCKSAMVNDAPLQDSKNSCASSSVSKRCGNSATRVLPFSNANSALTLKDDLVVKSEISRSRSTINRTATL